jgi:hypothetical protein
MPPTIWILNDLNSTTWAEGSANDYTCTYLIMTKQALLDQMVISTPSSDTLDDLWDLAQLLYLLGLSFGSGI